MQGQTVGLNFIQEFLYSFQKHNLELSRLVVIVTDGVTGSKNGIHDLGLQNEVIQYHCIIH